RFDLDPAATIVSARLEVARAKGAAADAALVLDGEELETLSVAIDGKEVAKSDYRVEKDSLTLTKLPAGVRFVLETKVRIAPEKNTALSGLYMSGSGFCTQCEAMGFRRITWFQDRPDVMARYTVTLSADKKRFPVLLSNGDRIETGDSKDGKHWARWVDPFPKPSYLFALVAGDLHCHAGTFKTMSGKDVRLEILVEHQNKDKCEHALRSLQRSMKWDEEVFGREYDLSIYMVVAVNDFNMGAMENKGLNVFNSKYVLASPATATDEDYEGIEGVIGHEYFHNWTGNRVTCRDWFQLTLKEGLTVFRDQQFTADMTSAAVKRISDVRVLRVGQFPEDAGPMAHPIRPESYISMDNFYTATVYRKGSEIIRLYHTLLGRDGFRKGMDLYFERHDGQAVTCDDFRAAMADANKVDLTKLGVWYEQAGTPVLDAQGEWDEKAKKYTLTLRQSYPPLAKGANSTPQNPVLIPVSVGLLGANGKDIPGTTKVLSLTEKEQKFVFENVNEKPVPSLLRGFSAPVRLKLERSRAELAFLMANDQDSFNRWDAGQTLAQQVLLELAAIAQKGQALPALEKTFTNAFKAVLTDAKLDGSLKALAMTLPAEIQLAQEVSDVDPDALHAAREHVRKELARELEKELLATADAAEKLAAQPAIEKPNIDARRLKNVCLAYLGTLAKPAITQRLLRQLEGALTMTDSSAALGILASLDVPERAKALEAFYTRWKDDPLVLDKWFTVQAVSSLPAAREHVAKLLQHPDFTFKNPNRVRSLIGAFAMSNQVRFHGKDGAGYALHADAVLELDALNPQVAARMVSAFNQWRRFEPGRRALMKAQLERVKAGAKSKDVIEIVGRALG
ncbi:MAG: aminopeptidase N, partial [Planctomycetota bacterium]